MSPCSTGNSSPSRPSTLTGRDYGHRDPNTPLNDTWGAKVHGVPTYMGCQRTWGTNVHGVPTCMGYQRAWGANVHGVPTCMGCHGLGVFDKAVSFPDCKHAQCQTPAVLDNVYSSQRPAWVEFGSELRKRHPSDRMRSVLLFSRNPLPKPAQPCRSQHNRADVGTALSKTPRLWHPCLPSRREPFLPSPRGFEFIRCRSGSRVAVAPAITNGGCPVCSVHPNRSPP